MLRCKEFKYNDISIKVVLDCKDIGDIISLPNDVYLFNENAIDVLQGKEVSFHLNKNFIGITTFNIEELNKKQLYSFLDKVKNNPISLIKKGYILSNAFKGVLVKEFIVDKDSLLYNTHNKNLVSKDKKTLICHHYEDIKELTLDSSYINIESHALSSLDKLNYINLNSIEEFQDDLTTCIFASLQTKIVLKAPNLKRIKLSSFLKTLQTIDSSILSNAILVFKQIIKNLPKFYYTRMLHGFYLYQDEFNTKEKKAYAKLLDNYKYDFYVYLLDKNIDKDVVNIDRIYNLIKDENDSCLNARELTKKLEFLVLYGDFSTLQNFLNKNKNFEFTNRALAFALRYRDSSIVKLLIDNKFNLQVTSSVSNDKDAYYSKTNNLILSLILDELATFADFDNEVVITDNDFYDENAECFALKVISLEERLKSLSYLLKEGNEPKFTFVTLYYYALCMNQKEISSYLYENGVRLNGSVYEDILTNGKNRYDFIDLIVNSIPLLYKYTQLEDLNIRLTKDDSSLIYYLRNENNPKEILNSFIYDEDCISSFIKEAIIEDESEILKLLLNFFAIDDKAKYLDFSQSENCSDEIVNILS